MPSSRPRGKRPRTDSVAAATTDRRAIAVSRDADEGIGFLLYHANLAWQRTLAEAFAPLGITHAQFAVLTAAWHLGRDGHLPLQRQVSDYVRFHATQTSSVMNVLLERHWVVRVADQHDGRASRVQVTDEGARVAADAIELLKASEQRFFPPGRDTQALIRGLNAIEARRADPPTAPGV